MAKIVFVWNFQTHKYELKKIPKGIDLFLSCKDLEKETKCASCYCETTFGVCYTSKQIHTSEGFGFPVCGDCYKKEVELDKKYA